MLQTTLKTTVGCRPTHPGMHFHCTSGFTGPALARLLESIARVSSWVERDDVVRNEREGSDNGVNSHFKYQALHTSPLVSPQTRGHVLKVSSADAKTSIHRCTGSGRQDTDINAIVMCPSSRRKVAQQTSHQKVASTVQLPFQRPLCHSFIVLVEYRSQTDMDLGCRSPPAVRSTPKKRVATVRAVWQTDRQDASKGFAFVPTLVLHRVIASQGWKPEFSC